MYAQLVSNYGDDDDVVPVNLEISRPEHIETLIRKYNPDLLKTDCEGCEIVLIEADEEALKKVPEYLIETHDHVSRSEMTSQIEDVFRRIGYSHETYEVLPSVRVVHAKRTWDSFDLSENEIVSLRNELLLNAERRHAASRNELGALRNERDKFRDELGALRNERDKFRDELGALRNERDKFRDELGALRNERDKFRDELELVRSQRDALREALGDTLVKLRHMRQELDTLKGSFGHRFMQFYSARIDRAFPDGTRRGEFRKIVVRGIQIALSEGVRKLLRMAWEKAKRHEFKIVQVTFDSNIGSLPLTLEPEGKILLHCDVPRLSSAGPTKVSDSIVVDGWALANRGIREVQIFLDDRLIGLADYGTVRPDIAEAYPEFPNSYLSGFRKLIALDHLEKKVPHCLKIVAVSDDLPPATVQGLIEIDASIRLERDPLTLETESQSLAGARVSVVIPTKRPHADLKQTLERIRNQRGINDPEIVILNSGNCDLSSLASDYKAAVHDIPPGSFSHGETRNQAAQMATGEYVVFMTDDAIPADPYLLQKMTGVLANDGTIGAVTARQIPRTDADMMYCQAIWGHYRMLGLDRDRVVGSTNLSAKSPQEKRSICQIDDVCSCFRRTQFLEHKYAIDVPYAEDLELGIRLVQHGFKIAQLFTTGVVHSHNRTPLYWARRSYVDFKVLQRLLNSEIIDFGSWSVKSPNDLLDIVLVLYRSLNLAIEDLIESGYCELSIDQTFNTIRSGIKHDFDPRTGSHALHQDVSEMLQRISRLLDHQPQEIRDTKHLTLRYLASLGTFQEWLTNSHKNLSSLEEDFVETLYKLFAVQVGDCFGQYFVYARKTGHHDEKILALDGYFSEGV